MTSSKWIRKCTPNFTGMRMTRNFSTRLTWRIKPLDPSKEHQQAKPNWTWISKTKPRLTSSLNPYLLTLNKNSQKIPLKAVVLIQPHIWNSKQLLQDLAVELALPKISSLILGRKLLRSSRQSSKSWNFMSCSKISKRREIGTKDCLKSKEKITYDYINKCLFVKFQ